VFVPQSAHSIEMQQLCDEVAELAAHISAATARWLRLLARLDEEAGWDEGYKTLAQWLSWRCGMSLATARDHVRTAQALKKRPLVAQAFERGELSYSKVRALMRLDDDFDEQLMLTYGRCASASQIETIVRGCRRCVAVEQGAPRQFAERSFSWGYDDDGAVVFRGRLPAEQGALAIRALEAARDELGPPPAEITEGAAWPESELTTSPSARRADAFVAVATTALAEKASSADVYQLVVHVDAEALSGTSDDDQDGCTLEDGAPLPAEVARRLACDASIVRVVEQDGKPLSIGRKTRTIRPALRRTLAMRDKGCTFPGCCQRHHVDAHHIEHWADGGATELDNLVQLCRFHHTLIHKALFKVRREADGGITFLRRNGTVVPQAPRQPRGDCTRLASANAARAVSPTGWSLYPEDPNPQADLALSVDALLETRPPIRE
jgi:Domain of unknown function (DUF222)